MTPKPRPMPTETLEGLIPPSSPFPYFAHPERTRFDPTATGDSPANASWLADASLAVYGSATFIRELFQASCLRAQGFELSFLGADDNNRGIVLQNDSALVFVFRGTRLQSHPLLDVVEVVTMNHHDLLTDSQFVPDAFPAGGKVHRGFLKAFRECVDVLDALVESRCPGQHIWLTGHSLGVLWPPWPRAHLGAETVQGLYTFGCPRVGDAAFTRVLPHRSYIRFVHRHDWVPTVPPRIFGYVHGGTLHRLTGTPRKFLDDVATGTREMAAAIRAAIANSNLNTGDIPVQGLRPGRPRAGLLRDPALECVGAGRIWKRPRPSPGGSQRCCGVTASRRRCAAWRRRASPVSNSGVSARHVRGTRPTFGTARCAVVTVAPPDFAVVFLVLAPAGWPDHFGFQFAGSTRFRQVILVTSLLPGLPESLPSSSSPVAPVSPVALTPSMSSV